MNTIKIKTTGMHCPSCSMLIEMNVGDLPGIDSVRASNADCLTTVTYDPNKVDSNTIVKEIRDAGYDAELLS